MSTFPFQNLSEVQMSQDSNSFHTDLTTPLPRHKTFSDRVHDQMKFHPLLCAIIDTPPFQRLRDLHQLGNCRYIYPGACNTRFEHSLGVAHLAGKMLRQLLANHRDEPGLEPLNVTEADVLCVTVAGLCHDLGHGPLSHMFELFVNKVRAKKGQPKWSHETASVQMLDYLLLTYNIDIARYGLQARDLEFIKILIHGLDPKAPWPGETIGRPESLRWIFDIVANQRNGVDVDKLDYFLRDNMSAYGKLPDIQIDRILSCARVCTCDGQRQVCFEEKVAMCIRDLFILRAKLHKNVYQHRVVLLLDQMTIDALVAAEEHFLITLPESGGKSFTLSQTVESMEAYVRTGDWIACALQWSTSPELKETRDILQRIRSRHLYSYFGCYSFHDPATNHVANIGELLQKVPADIRAQMPHDVVFHACSRIVVGSSGDDEHEEAPRRAGEDGSSTPPLSPTESKPSRQPTLLGLDDDLSPPPPARPPLSPMPRQRSLGIAATMSPPPPRKTTIPQRRDPLESVRFFNPKRSLEDAYAMPREASSPLFLPAALQENIAYFFSRDPAFQMVLYEAFKQWWADVKRNSIRAALLATPIPTTQPSPYGRRRIRDPTDDAGEDGARPQPPGPIRFSEM